MKLFLKSLCLESKQMVFVFARQILATDGAVVGANCYTLGFAWIKNDRIKSPGIAQPQVFERALIQKCLHCACV